VTPTIANTATPTRGPLDCGGDCDGDGQVSINELILGVNIALGTAAADSCAAFDRNRDGQVSVSELIAASTLRSAAVRRRDRCRGDRAAMGRLTNRSATLLTGFALVAGMLLARPVFAQLDPPTPRRDRDRHETATATRPTRTRRPARDATTPNDTADGAQPDTTRHTDPPRSHPTTGSPTDGDEPRHTDQHATTLRTRRHRAPTRDAANTRPHLTHHHGRR
jgi:hypothetical protein